jgi:hypothetical protein
MKPMNLFPYEPARNLLPYDGIVNYFGPILSSREHRIIFKLS